MCGMMLPNKDRLRYLLVVFLASFALLNSVIFLVHSVYHQDTLADVCTHAGHQLCGDVNEQLFSVLSAAHRLNIQGSFYLLAILTLFLIPVLRKQELYRPTLYSFSTFSAGFAFSSMNNHWFFDVGSSAPDTMVSVLLFLIFLGISYLLFMRAEILLQKVSFVCQVREPLVKPRRRGPVSMLKK